MGLFDKKKGDDFGSPVEQIDLNTLSAPVSRQTAAVPAPQAHPVPVVEAEPPLRYGINQAIELMRSLPAENVELVVQVVKRTLESTRIRIDTIIQDATRKQTEIEGRIGVLNKEIAELDREISTRRSEISVLETDHKETSMVKDRLVLAEKLTAEKTGGEKSGPHTAKAGAERGAPAATRLSEETTPPAARIPPSPPAGRSFPGTTGPASGKK